MPELPEVEVTRRGVAPHLEGRISGAAVRVPSISVSAVDLTVTLAQKYTALVAVFNPPVYGSYLWE